jgi:hypothetical protein
LKKTTIICCIIAIVFCILAVAIFANSSRRKLVYKDKNVVVSEGGNLKNSVVQIINHHSASWPLRLTVCGRDYDNVFGQPPYYLKTNEPSCVVFATSLGDESGKCDIHVVDQSSCKSTAFVLNNDDVGGALGGTNVQSSIGYVQVSWADSNILLLQLFHPDSSRQGKWRLNLVSGEVDVSK